MASRFENLLTLVRHNWQLKLVALLLAVMTVKLIRSMIAYEVEYEVPIEVKTEPGIAVLSQEPDTARVRLRGSQTELLQFDSSRLRVVVQSKVALPDGVEREVRLAPRDVRGAAGMSVVRVAPESVRVTFDREIETTFAVGKPGIVGVPLVGRAEIEYKPETVRVRGPKRRLEEWHRYADGKLATEPVDVEGRVQSFTKTVKIIQPADTRLSLLDPSEISVRVNIITCSAVREWKDLPISALLPSGFAGRVAMHPETADVSIAADAEILEHVNPQTLLVFANCQGLTPPAEAELPVQAELPHDSDVKVSVSPPTVHVKLLAEP